MKSKEFALLTCPEKRLPETVQPLHYLSVP